MAESEERDAAIAETLRLHVDPSDALREALQELYTPEAKHKVGKLTLRSVGSLRVVNLRGTVYPEGSVDPALSNHVLEYGRALESYRSHRLPLASYLKGYLNPRGLARIELAVVPLAGHRDALEKIPELPLPSPPGDEKLRSILVYAEIMPHDHVADLKNAAEALRKHLKPFGNSGMPHNGSLNVSNPQLVIRGEPYALPASAQQQPHSA